MINFRQLFSFKKKEIDAAFNNIRSKKTLLGLKLLLPDKDSKQIRDETPLTHHGKLLIIIPQIAGKAPTRNLLRRRIKAIYFEEKLYEKPIISILLVYKEAIKLSFDEIKSFLVRNLK